MNPHHPAPNTLAPMELIELVAQRPAALDEATRAAANALGETGEGARPWALAGLAYLLDAERSELVWLIGQPLGFWQRCGFSERPHHQRFADVVAQLACDFDFVGASRTVARELQARLARSPVQPVRRLHS